MSYNKHTKKFEGFIYLIYNDVTCKVYIGKTSRDIISRYKGHCSKTAHKQDNSILHKAMDKYGIEKFHIKEIEKICADSKEELIESLNIKEKECISVYNSITPNGYNILKGGEYTPNNRIKPVYKFDLLGNYLMSFDSISDALVDVGESNLKSERIQNHFSTDCKAYDYLWSESIYDNPFEKYQTWLNKKKNKKGRNIYPKVCQYGINKRFIRYYDTVPQAAKDVFHKYYNLYPYISGRNNHLCRNYFWYYANDETQPNKSKILLP